MILKTSRGFISYNATVEQETTQKGGIPMLLSALQRQPTSHGKRLLTAILAAGLAAAPAAAHQTFLLPSEFVWENGETVTVDLTSALSFPDLEHGPARDRIAFSQAAIGGEPVGALSFNESETALEISFDTNRTGLAIVAASSKPRAGQIPPEDVDMYLDEIEADASVREAFDALPGSPPLDRSYSKHAKTFFCIDACDNNGGASTPVGQKLEFVASGARAKTFVLLLDGKPLAGKAVTVVPVDGEAMQTATDENGTIAVSAPVSGVVMLSAVWITLPASADGVYHSDYATLTVDLGRRPSGSK